MLHKMYVFCIIGILLTACNANQRKENDPAAETQYLQSWNDGNAKAAIVHFVQMATDSVSKAFIPENERIAVFDNDGTLWSEQPMYFQLAYVMYYIRNHIDDNPEWLGNPYVHALLQNDYAFIFSSGENALMHLSMLSHANMSAGAFQSAVHEWLANDRHPVTGKAYTQMVYQPMLELLEYLRANGFKTFIVSGGGTDFMRVWAKEVYGIPPY
ncbi:MAG: HAD family hydrolase, partial [Chitinophagales bacterium]